MNFLDKVQASKGLLLVYTGDGKGKTTGALGVAFRAMGRGLRVGMVQFIKGKWMTGERMMAKNLPLLDFYVVGRGCIRDVNADLTRDHQAALMVWARAKEMMQSGEYPLVILDEITFALKFGFITLDDVIAEIGARKPFVTVIITGRGAAPELMEMADLVSEMRAVKHPYEKGELAKVAIDY